MPPHLKVSKATKAAIDCTEMDSQLEALRRNCPMRISTSDRSSARFLIGSRNTMLDTACEMLAPDLRPVPPQPNCPQSMQIYEEHRKMAAEYLQKQSEIAKQREYKAQLADKIKENQEIINSRTPTAEDLKQYNRLKEEKEALLAFKGKLSEQLLLIKEAQQKKSGSAHSSQTSNNSGGAEGWVVVNSKPPERKYFS